MVPRSREWTGDDRGTAVIEFAILTPVFLLMLTGMLAYGIYFGAAHALQQLAADAARTAIAGINAAEGRLLVETYLRRNAGDYMLIDYDKLDFSLRVPEAGDDQYRVTLVYDAGHLPIWNLYPPLPLPEPRIVRGATILRGGI
jgi:Flp pilus assembly protein TadG